MDGEPATKSLVRAIAERLGASDSAEDIVRFYSHQSQGPFEACIQVFRGVFVANKMALEAGIGCRLLLKHPSIERLDPSRLLS